MKKINITIENTQTLYEHDHVSGDSVLDITVLEGAQLTYIIQSSGMNVERIITVQKNASSVVYDFQVQVSARSHTRHILAGEGARGEIRGVFIGGDSYVFDIATISEHRASHTTSDILVKGVLGGKAYARYEGMVRIQEGAQGCSGYQKEDTLLLSMDARIDAQPDLEIANNDVSCSHAVTTTRINPEKLFYARSRGISEDDAKKLFIEGHFSEVLEGLPRDAKESVILTYDI
jgi:Fe-S cluster assembly protein SufD